VALLAVGVLRLRSAFKYGFLTVPKKINFVTSVLIIMVAVIIFYFTPFGGGTLWLRFLFGTGLLSYGVARVAVGASASESDSCLRAPNALIGLLIAVFAITAIAFPLVQIRPDFYWNYAFFVNMAFGVVGIDCIATATLGLRILQENS
jgi:uncharacterized membrane protein HdeD (DUF308 family)